MNIYRHKNGNYYKLEKVTPAKFTGEYIEATLFEHGRFTTIMKKNVNPKDFTLSFKI